jgi:hypothetical protein
MNGRYEKCIQNFSWKTRPRHRGGNNIVIIIYSDGRQLTVRVPQFLEDTPKHAIEWLNYNTVKYTVRKLLLWYK